MSLYDCSKKAGEALKAANRYACRKNHEYIGTEHILHGLIQDFTSFAGQIFVSQLGYDAFAAINAELEKLVHNGPDAVLMDKLPHTPRAKKIMEIASSVAREASRDVINTCDILQGVFQEKEGIACHVLTKVGVTWEVFCLAKATINMIDEDSWTPGPTENLVVLKPANVNELTFRRPRNIRIWQTAIPTIIDDHDVTVDVLVNFTEEGLIIDVVQKGQVIETSSETYEELLDRLTTGSSPGEKPAVALMGNPTEGFEAVGPFRNWEAASAWSEGRLLGSWIMTMKSPLEMLDV